MKQLIKNFIVRQYLRRPNLTCHGLPEFNGRPWPKFQADGPLVLGPRCGFRAARFRTHILVLKGGSLEIGKECFFNDGVLISASSRITIGDYSGLSDRVTLMDTHFHPVDYGEKTVMEPITIGRNVWIGHGVMVLPGAVIGDHSVIGAQSVVSGVIPPRVVAIGFPARPVRTLKCPDDWIRARD